MTRRPVLSRSGQGRRSRLPELPVLGRAQELRLAAVSAALLVTVVGSAGATLSAGASPTRPSFTGTRTGTVAAVDVVDPTPIPLTFARPVPPGALHPAARPVVAVPVPTHSTGTTAATGTAAAACTGAGWQQRRGAAALASLLHPRPAGVTVAFLAGGGALKGLTYYDTHRVDIYVGPCAVESGALLRHVVAHELGHAWDSLHMTDGLRARYLAARGLPAGTPWFGCDRCQDFATPAGDFAETYAQWQRGATDSRSTMAPAATASQLAELGGTFFS